MSVCGRRLLAVIIITHTTTTTITPTATTTISPTKIPALMNINTSLPLRLCMPSSHTPIQYALTLHPPAPMFSWTLQELQKLRLSLGGGGGGGKGRAPTLSTAAKKSHHHLAILIHHYHNNEYNINTTNKRNTVSATHTQEKYISSPHTNRSAIQCQQLSRIRFFSIQFFSNPI